MRGRPVGDAGRPTLPKSCILYQRIGKNGWRDVLGLYASRLVRHSLPSCNLGLTICRRSRSRGPALHHGSAAWAVARLLGQVGTDRFTKAFREPRPASVPDRSASQARQRSTAVPPGSSKDTARQRYPTLSAIPQYAPDLASRPHNSLAQRKRPLRRRCDHE